MLYKSVQHYKEQDMDKFSTLLTLRLLRRHSAAGAEGCDGEGCTSPDVDLKVQNVCYIEACTLQRAREGQIFNTSYPVQLLRCSSREKRCRVDILSPVRSHNRSCAPATLVIRKSEKSIWYASSVQHVYMEQDKEKFSTLTQIRLQQR